MKRALNSLLSRMPPVRRLAAQVTRQGVFPAGHYYSPVPSAAEVLAYLKLRKPLSRELPGINLNEQRQLELLNEYTKFYEDLPFTEEQTPELRYYYRNTWFSYGDAIFLYCFLRQQLPKRIIEVGSGFSSALMLDTIDRFLPERPDITLIEPHPERLNDLLRDGDRKRVRLIDSKLQDVRPEVFSGLGAGDLLFVDSSHVVKCGSDLLFLMFEVLPHLEPGVVVHFHDVFYPFDYPAEWLTEGRYWNENYFLRAFLSYNSEWSIQFFNNYLSFVFGDLMKEKMPLCARMPGAGLYIQREHKG